MDGYSICVPADVSRLCCIYATTQSLRVWEMGLCLCDVSGRLRSKLAHCLMTVTAANNGAHKGIECGPQQTIRPYINLFTLC